MVNLKESSMSTPLKCLTFLGPLLGIGFGGYIYINFVYYRPLYANIIAEPYGIAVLVISFVGLVGALLVTIGLRIGLRLMLLSGILSCLLVYPIPAGVLELFAVFLIKRGKNRRKG